MRMRLQGETRMDLETGFRQAVRFHRVSRRPFGHPALPKGERTSGWFGHARGRSHQTQPILSHAMRARGMEASKEYGHRISDLLPAPFCARFSSLRACTHTHTHTHTHLPTWRWTMFSDAHERHAMGAYRETEQGGLREELCC